MHNKKVTLVLILCFISIILSSKTIFASSDKDAIDIGASNGELSEITIEEGQNNEESNYQEVIENSIINGGVSEKVLNTNTKEPEETSDIEIKSFSTMSNTNDQEDGDSVVKLKQDLTTLGFGRFPSSPSNVYGSVTERVVREFQQYYGLRVDGKANKESLNKINEILSSNYRSGQSGAHVVELKVKLTTLGFGNFPSNPSGVYGSVTERVVSEFQSYYGLAVNGIADEVTLNSIEELLSPPYRIGDSGQHIVKLKQDLTRLGFGNFPSNPSSLYGSVTSRVVREFQAYYGLTEDGVAGKQTLSKINEVLSSIYSSGQSGAHIVELKEKLTKLGFGNFPSNPSGAYGNVTARVVSEFQAYYGLVVNGIADEVTLNKINKIISSPYQTGKSGVHVVELKEKLTQIGFGNFPSNPSGAYGNVTTKVVSEFQAYYGLVVNGIADEVTLAKVEEIFSRARIIVLDPGHGAKDPGGRANGLVEKSVVLDISLRARDLLQAAGYVVIMTRSTDEYLTLEERAKIGNTSNADIFISVHANIFNGTANGTETFWNNNHKGSDSRRLAHAVQNAVVSNIGTNSRRVDQASFHVIRETKIPSILLEVGFLDHSADAGKLKQSTYRQRAAQGILEGVNEYFK
ncbi:MULTISPECIES: peptidoglycan-binding protein [Bacillaceae]|uniref:Peptidoglycan-binding protein n=1 Tax=Evansella alkalicola TaxID=745819 RepID=A0ABS6JT51_9BACI|nr:MULTISPECIES: peptidoglycan-binding protein [Bacillaceae]MBU9721748.1 peptidoglycan-binding protein [Bacillus alkalicola]